jgi:hypothetical protein
LTISDGSEFDKKTRAVPPSLIDFALATIITNDELLSSPRAQKAHGDAEPTGDKGEYGVGIFILVSAWCNCWVWGVSC